MVETEDSFSTIQARACLAENIRPFFWVGILCATYGYIPYVWYGAPILLYLGLWMVVISLGVRVFSAPIIASLRVMRQVWTGGLPLFVLARKLSLVAVLASASLGGTALLGKVLAGLAGLN